jgi:hypothetical protein
MRQFFTLLVLSILNLTVQSQTPLLSESFEGTFPPSGWTIARDGSGNNWTKGSSLSYDGMGTMQYNYRAGEAANAWAITPGVALNTNPCYVTFYVTKNYGYPQKLKFTVGNANNIAAQTTVLKDDNYFDKNSYQKWSATFTPSTSGYYYFGFNCYSDAGYYYGIIIDSVTIRQTPVACSSTPDGGATTSANNPICPNTTFILNVANATSFVTGLTYQWQSSTDNTIWNDIVGATEENFTNNGGITSATYYRRRINCGNKEAFSTSTLVSLKSNSAAAYSPLPFSENFEASWQDQCGGSNSLPSSNWLNERETYCSGWT